MGTKWVQNSRQFWKRVSAWVSPDPRGLLCAGDPIGPENLSTIKKALREADYILCGWGWAYVWPPHAAESRRSSGRRASPPFASASSRTARRSILFASRIRSSRFRSRRRRGRPRVLRRHRTRLDADAPAEGADATGRATLHGIGDLRLAAVGGDDVLHGGLARRSPPSLPGP